MSKPSVRWKRNARTLMERPDAEVALEEITRISKENGGHATAEAVVESSRPKGSPLHKCFDWNNRSASHKWRCHQAREIMNSIELVILEEDPEDSDAGDAPAAPAFVSIERYDPEGSPGYRPITVVLNDSGLREKMVQQAWRDLQTWRRRYEHLNEFASIHDAIKRERQRKRA